MLSPRILLEFDLNALKNFNKSKFLVNPFKIFEKINKLKKFNLFIFLK
jgi:hypothetical protein